MTRRRVLAAVAGLAVLALGLLVLAGRDPGSQPAAHPPAGQWLPSGPNRRAVVWAVGDGADGGIAARTLARRIRADRPDRFLYLGDVYGPDEGVGGLLESDGTREDFRDGYEPVYGRLRTRTAPTPGNHEWPRRGEGYEPYWRRVTGRTPPAYYSFRVAGWQILSLNSEASHSAESPQVRWARGQVRGGGSCRIAFWHRPRFSAGRHGDQADVDALWRTVRGRAALVLNGHDHDLQRFAPIGGTTQMVVGAGGHGHYKGHADPRLRFSNDRVDGALRLSLRPGRASYAFIDAAGRQLDAGRLRCARPR